MPRLTVASYPVDRIVTAIPRNVLRLRAAALCGALCFATPAPVLAQTFTVVDLGALAPPGRPSVAFTIDNAGHVVGYSGTPQNLQAVEWIDVATPQRKLVKLGPAGQNSVAFSIKNGVIVGEIDPAGVQEAERFDNNSLLDQADDAAKNFNIAFNSDGSGVIVGMAGSPAGATPHAMVFPNDNLGSAPSVAYDVNQNQVVVGTAVFSGSASQAFRHSGTPPLVAGDNLGTLPGGRQSEATCINAAGEIAGWSNIAGNRTSHAFLWTSGTMSDLGLPPPRLPAMIADQTGRPHCVVRASTFTRLQGTADREGGECINSRRSSGGEPLPPQVVGYTALYFINVPAAACIAAFARVSTANSFRRAFFFDGTTMHDLNTMIPAGTGWYLESAFGINNSSQIVGQGWIGGEHHAFLLLP
jgi:probable HAF family extracellular repeat protein